MIARVAILLMLVVATGCTTASTYPTRGDRLVTGVAFSEVAVQIDPSLPADRLVTFRQNRGTYLLRDAIVATLERQGRIDPSAKHQLEIQVVGFRLRSGWDGILNGALFDALAGGYISDEDFLTVEVSVLRSEEPELQTGASSASGRGGIFFFRESGRLANLSRAIAEVLTDRI